MVKEKEHSINKDLECQYSPSRWSQRYKDPETVIKKHIEVITKASNYAKEVIPVEFGVSYGPTEDQLLDIFGGQSLKNDAPILVYVHGGYWQELSRSLSAYCVLPQYRAGIRVIIVGYDLAPKVKLGVIVEEIKSAASYIVKMAAKLGSRSVWFVGHSAGAHLVSMLLYSGWLNQLDNDLQLLIKGFFLISGVYDLTPLINTYVNNALYLSRDEAASYSPMLLDIKSSPGNGLKIIIAVGEHDSPEFQHQTYKFAEKLEKYSKLVEVMTVPNVDHFDIVEKLQEEEFMLTKKIIDLITAESG